jgi:hypothetical protein
LFLGFPESRCNAVKSNGSRGEAASPCSDGCGGLRVGLCEHAVQAVWQRCVLAKPFEKVEGVVGQRVIPDERRHRPVEDVWQMFEPAKVFEKVEGVIGQQPERVMQRVQLGLHRGVVARQR